MQAFGWRDAVVILGIILAVTTIPLHALILRRRPSDLGLLPDGEEEGKQKRVPLKILSLSDALRNPFFWRLTAAFSLAFLAASAIRVHFIPFLIDAGINSSSAALASGAIGLMQVVGRLAFIPLESRLTGRIMVSLVLALQGVAMSFFLLGVSATTVVIFVGVFGAAYGAQVLARASIIGELFGSSHYGQISSIMSIFLTVSGTLAPVGAGLVYDHFQSYQPVLWGSVLIAGIATGIILLSKPQHNTPTA